VRWEGRQECLRERLDRGTEPGLSQEAVSARVSLFEDHRWKPYGPVSASRSPSRLLVTLLVGF